MQKWKASRSLKNAGQIQKIFELDIFNNSQSWQLNPFIDKYTQKFLFVSSLFDSNQKILRIQQVNEEKDVPCQEATGCHANA